jgi:hypothetical protein
MSASAAATEAQILDAYHGYWHATVAAQRGNPDRVLFVGNTGEKLTEQEIAQATYYQKYEIVRQGEPSFSHLTVTVHGDTADVWACVDNSKWIVPEATGAAPGVLPTGLHLERTDGTWLVTEYLKLPSALTC